MSGTIQRFANETPFGGVYYAVRASKPATKAFWAIILTGCVLGWLTQVVLYVKHYKEALPDTSLAIIPTKELKLPDVVICTPVHFDKNRLKKWGVSKTVSDYLHLGYLGGNIPSVTGRELFEQIGDTTATIFSGTAAFLKYNATNPTTHADLIKKLSFQCEDIFHGTCYVHGVPENCCAGARRLWTFQGLCFQFPGRKQFVSGSGNGMIHRIVLPAERLMSGPNIHFNDGVAVRLSSKGEMEPDVALAPLGSRVHIGVGITHGIYLSTAHNPCQQNPAVSSYGCFGECLANSILQGCPCVPIDLTESLKDRPICSPIELFGCFEQKQVNFDDFEALTSRQSNCSESCPTNCEMWEFSKEVSVFRSSAELLQNYTDNSTAHEWAKNTIVLDIFFGEMQTTEIRQFYSTTISDLFGLVGGLLGLWFGGSIIAFVHLICFWVMCEKDARERSYSR